MEAYFSEYAHTGFSVPIVLRGTDFQRRVWSAMQDVPSGTTLTYGALATRLQSGPRAVAGACRENPLPILIPCHRIVAADGIGGYCGASDKGPWIEIKRWLLRREGAVGAL
jgi:methylated-DNA-[protein]-cysteine S-methyltransferase